MVPEEELARGLLDGIEKPMDRPQAWTEALNKSGAVGRVVAAELTTRFTGGIDETTVEGLQSALERAVYTAQQAILGAACMAKQMDMAIEELPDATARVAVRLTADAAFRSALPRALSAMQAVTALVGSGHEDEGNRTARFIDALGLLPDPPKEAAEGDDAEEEEDIWPDLGEGLDGIAITWLPFIHRKTSFLFRNLPVTARALYLRCL